MTISVPATIWRHCPLRRHLMLGKVDRSPDFGKGSPMIESNYGVDADRDGSTSQGESTLLPMLIGGLVSIIVGLTIVAWFV